MCIDLEESKIETIALAGGGRAIHTANHTDGFASSGAVDGAAWLSWLDGR